MTDIQQQDPTFREALGRLEEIVSEVKKKETDLDRSLELLEEGVALANVCTEKIDHTRIVGQEQEQGEQEALAGESELS